MSSSRWQIGRLSTRLIVIFSLLVAGMLLVVAGVVALLSRAYLTRTLDTQIQSAVQSFLETVPTDAGERELGTAARTWLEHTALPSDQLVAIRLPDGRVLTSTSELELASVSEGRGMIAAADPRWWTVTADGTRIRALSVPIPSAGPNFGTILSAASREPTEQTLSALLSRIGWATLVGLLLAALIGLFAIRRTMKPLEVMAAEMRAIQETGDLSRRLARHGPPDEVLRLAHTFDALLAKLQSLVESKERFVSDASHELRTPLTVARGQLELLIDPSDTGDPQQRMNVVLDELDRMGEIVEDLLLLARLDEGMPVEQQPVEVELVMRDALLRGLTIENRDATVEVEPRLFVLGDEERLLQVLTNLVVNAVKHTPSDARLALRAESEGGAAVIQISDTGPGIPSGELAHVFERLYRGSTARSSTTGAGLGLAIASSLVTAMGGTIEVASGDSGTTFTVRLQRAEAPTTGPPPSADPPSAAELKDSGSGKVPATAS
ncbi:MAG TPA: HAMP domain-containing sensor histidine kinase [Actinomycetota bacterium]|nr:HAMP domain-containing sensor histidine kinase [Actinomycetota bacterium]